MNDFIRGNRLNYFAVFLLAVLPAAAANAASGGAELSSQPHIMAVNVALLGPGPIGMATSSIYFAQVAIGGGNTTTISLVNTGPDPTTGTLFLTANNATPLVAALSSPGLPSTNDSSFPISIPSGGSQIITAGPVSAGSTTVSGWARVDYTGGALQGVATFTYIPGNTLLYVVGVLSAGGTPVATIPLNEDHVQLQDTGYAVANPGNTPINVKIVMVHPDGTVHQTIFPPSLNPLPPGGHYAAFLWQELNDPFLLFNGSMVLIEQGGNPFAVVALVENGSLFSAVPVIPGSSPNIR